VKGGGATWRALGAAPPRDLFENVVGRYSEPHRRYHTATHLEECFDQLDAVRADAERPGEVELALWFHDAIYDTRRHDNEQRSAEWARSVADDAGLDAAVGKRVAALIMATRHDVTPEGADARVLVDVDLSILGASSTRFDEYERDVRAEYDWVPAPVFRRERRKILERILGRERIYGTQRIRESHEAGARANLTRSLATLARRKPRPWPVALALGVVAGGIAGFFVEGPLWLIFVLAGVVVLLYELAAPWAATARARRRCTTGRARARS
jgi:predicted metal-dependent HD superfamily phosphohydrolase